MSKLKAKIENYFGVFGQMVYDHRLKVLLLCLIFWGLLLPNLRDLQVDTSNESFLHKNDPILVEYNNFRDQFGRDELAIITLKSKDGIFNLPFLTKLNDLHTELEDNVPHLDDITSLVNARFQIGSEDELLVEDFMKDFPKTEKEAAALKDKAKTQPNYFNLLLSEDMNVTTVVLRSNTYSGEDSGEDLLGGFDDTEVEDENAEKVYLTAAENGEFVNAAREILDKYRSDDFVAHVAGSAIVIDQLKLWMQSDVSKFVRLCVLVIGVLLFAMFRRFSCVIMPLLIVILTLLSTIALMAVSGIAFKLPTSVLPSFILAVGVGAAVHILTIVLQHMRRGNSKRDSVIYALSHSGLAVLLTSLTTAGGLLSFSTASVAPIAELGIFSSIGVMLSFTYTMILIPAIIALVPFKVRKSELEAEKGASKFDIFLANLGSFSVRHYKAVLFVSALVLVISIVGITKVRFSHDVLKWLPQAADVTQGTLVTDKEMRGSVNLEVVLDTGEPGGLYNPEIMSKIDDFDTFAESYEKDEIFVGKSSSLSDILKEINRALNENRDSHYSIPDNKQLVAQEFLLFENSGSDDLEDFVDTQFQKTRISLKSPWLDAILYTDYLEFISQKAKETFGDVSVTVTGVMAIFSRVMTATIHSMAQSYIIAAGVISVLMVLLIGRLRMGLISMIPNLLPIVMAIGIIGWFDLPMDLYTMMVGSISIGLAVDDTIHFMHNFIKHFNKTNNVEESVRRTLSSTGRAMMTTTMVLSAGFFIYMFAMMNNLFNFGMITAIAIIFALLSDFFVAPALMALFAKTKEN